MFGWASAMRSMASRQCPNSVASERRNLRRAGTASNSWRTSTVVPGGPEAGLTCRLAPSICQACSPSRVREMRVTCATDAMEASASPRNPMEATDSSSASERILLVACRASASGSSPGGMPKPSSVTAMRRMPPPSSRTSMARAPASMAFSRISLSTEAGRSMTSPAAIWLISRSGSARMERRSVMRRTGGRTMWTILASRHGGL
ncbi:hypothetical protein AD428_15785 [Achromobacter sp. DMS1]|nr:hypothetical protein AD428_15785 [Achromobacter sp. DMS1]